MQKILEKQEEDFKGYSLKKKKQNHKTNSFIIRTLYKIII